MYKNCKKPVHHSRLLKDCLYCRVAEQQYVTVLYNDEMHSYDDVIGALTRPDVGLDQMGAVAMATNVDSLVSLYMEVMYTYLCVQHVHAFACLIIHHNNRN